MIELFNTTLAEGMEQGVERGMGRYGVSATLGLAVLSARSLHWPGKGEPSKGSPNHEYVCMRASKSKCETTLVTSR